jgi:phosphoribosylaminoimidazolecarboxamide formyltransferase / IMP cyclohydrolase
MANRKIQSALISVFYKDGLEPLLRTLADMDITLFSTGGTQTFIESLGLHCIPVEDMTGYPSILGGRVKTLHPKIFGGILGRRDLDQDVKEMEEYAIPNIDLVIVDLYPFEETVASGGTDQAIVEKVDIGGVSLIRAAGKNHKDVLIVASKNQYEPVRNLLLENDGQTTIEDRMKYAAEAFAICANYDVAISNWFMKKAENVSNFQVSSHPKISLRYGENPHQNASFFGDINKVFDQLHGKELSYNNLVDVDAAVQIISEFKETTFAIIKHTNVCGIASRNEVLEAWKEALSGDPESAFGGILVTNSEVDEKTAEAISELFFEVLIAPSFSEAALTVLKAKKNRILLVLKNFESPSQQYRNLLNGTLVQNFDEHNISEWDEKGGRMCTQEEEDDLIFANIVCKHLKSNAIALVKDKKLIGKGCGQTSRIDSLRQAIDKSYQFNESLSGVVLASDAFFPFDDCIKLAHEEGITAFIQPGGSVRDIDSITYAKENGLAMVFTGRRHFKH